MEVTRRACAPPLMGLQTGSLFLENDLSKAIKMFPVHPASSRNHVRRDNVLVHKALRINQDATKAGSSFHDSNLANT